MAGREALTVPCEGSGDVQADRHRISTGYGECPVCGNSFASEHGYLIAHRRVKV